MKQIRKPVVRLRVLDMPVDECGCGAPWIVALASGVRLCCRCDIWPERDAVLELIAEAGS